MKKFGPSFLISLLLHVGLILLAFISWHFAPPPIKVASVPVTVISDMPSRQMAEAPVDELAVKTPEPIPQPDPVPPQPTPAPPQPVPEPIKPTVKPTPTPPKPAPVPPDKNGLKKPEPTQVKKPTPAKPTPTPPKAKPQDDLLSRLAATPSQAPTRRAASPSTQKTTGLSAQGSGPADAGQKAQMSVLTQRLMKLWLLNCDVPGSDEVNAQVQFVLSPNGRVIDGPNWLNRRSDPVWQASANLAMAAVNKGQPNAYLDLTELHGKKLTINFDAQKACQGR